MAKAKDGTNRGRRSKLDARRQTLIVGYLRTGMPRVQAAKLAGISEKTFYNWLERGEGQTRGQFFQFLQAVEHAELEAERMAVQAWAGFALEDWRAAQAFLERRFPERWAAIKERAEDESHREVYVVREDQLTREEWEELVRHQQKPAASPQ